MKAPTLLVALGICAAGCTGGPSSGAVAPCTPASDPVRVASRAVVLTSIAGRGSYQASIYRPKNRRRFRGRRPSVVLMHGTGADQCDLSWAAVFLASRGYVALAPTDRSGGKFGHDDPVRSGVRFLRGRANPYRRTTDRKRIGLVGHSRGAGAVTSAEETSPGVRAVVALDLLPPRVAVGDSLRPARPHHPALSLASEMRPASGSVNADGKKRGYEVWRRAGKPTMAVVLRGFGHGAFAHQGSAAQHRLISHYMLAWLDRWLRKRRSATRRLLAKRIRGTRTVNLLSVQFRSAAFLPRRIDCEDFAACLMRR